MPIYSYGKKLLDKDGNIILPLTRSKFVFMDDGRTLEEAILPYYMHIEKGQTLNTTGIARSLVRNAADTEWTIQETANPEFNDGTTSIVIMIRLLNTTAYNIQRSQCVLYLSSGENMNVVVSKMKFDGDVLPDNPSKLISTGTTYLKSSPTYQEGGGSIGIYPQTPVENKNEDGNCCIVIQLTGTNIRGRMETTVIGNNFLKSRPVNPADVFTQVANSDNLAGFPNPFKGLSLQSILLQLYEKEINTRPIK